MRTALLLIFTLLLLLGGFTAYLWLQPARPPLTRGPARLGPTTSFADVGQSGQLVGPAAGVWVSQYDERNRLRSRFRFARSIPSEQGRMLLEGPEAEFHLEQRIVRVTGREGVVVRTAEPAGPRTLEQTPAELGMPSRGQLSDVRIALFDTPEQAAADQATLTVHTPNVSFDNDSFRIVTDAYTAADGSFVAADQVPVEVRGRDVEFRGRGLVVRWNDIDQQLDLLEITHGESLVVRGVADKPKAKAAASRVGPQTGTAMSEAAATPDVAAPSTRPTTRRAQPVYRATFESDVRIVRDGQPIAAGNVMTIDLQPEALSRRGPQERAAAAARPATMPTDARQATTQPAEDESAITVTWTGRLRVVPNQTPADPPLPPGEALARLLGEPVVLSLGEHTVHAASFSYRTDSQSGSARGSQALPIVTLRDRSGGVVETQQVDYSGVDGTAVLRGASRAVIPGETGAVGRAGEPLIAEWSEAATMRFEPAAPSDESGQAVLLHEAELAGSVRLRHPQLDLDSEKLELEFAPASEPPTTQPATHPSAPAPVLERAVARGQVRAQLRTPGDAPQTLAAQELTLDLARGGDGELYPRLVVADGDVAASDGRNALRASHVQARLQPTTRPAEAPDASVASGAPTTDVSPRLELQSLDARQAVVEQDGQRVAEADQLLLESRPAGQVAQLIGQPARVYRGEDVLSGPMIRWLPGQQRMEVLGAGSIRATPAQADQPAAPVDVSWDGQVQADLAANTIEVWDDVLVSSRDSRGTETTARSERARVVLRDALPATQPTTAPTTAPESVGGGLIPGEVGENLARKEPVSITLLEQVRLEMVRNTAAGEVEQRAFISAPQASYDLLARRVDIPQAGEMLVEDHSPGADATRRGATAFRWSRSLTATDGGRQIEILGDIVIRHVPDDTNARPLTMQTQRVTAALSNAAAAGDTPSTRPASEPTTRPADLLGGSQLTLSDLRADGGVRVVSGSLSIDAEQARFDPITRILDASGADGRPLYFHDAQSGSDGTAESIRLNTRTGEAQVQRLATQLRP